MFSCSTHVPSSTHARRRRLVVGGEQDRKERLIAKRRARTCVRFLFYAFKAVGVVACVYTSGLNVALIYMRPDLRRECRYDIEGRRRERDGDRGQLSPGNKSTSQSRSYSSTSLLLVKTHCKSRGLDVDVMHGSLVPVVIVPYYT